MVLVKECDIMKYTDNTGGNAVTTTPTKTTSAYEQLLQDIIAGKYNAPSISADQFTGQAQNLIGGLDTSGFEQLRGSLQSSYETAQKGLEQSYQTMLQNLATEKKTSQKQLAGARGTIMEDAFTRNRDLYRNLAARGLGASGLQQLGEIQNRMETGRQVSGVTGQYYDTAEKLAQAEQQGTQQYQQSGNELTNQLQQNLAGVQQQEVSYRNAYQQQLASIALQLQNQAQSSANTAYASKLSAMTELAQLADSRNSETAKINIVNSAVPFEDKVTAWMDTFKTDEATARKEVTARSEKYKAGLVSEVLGNYDEQAKEIDDFSKTSSFFTNMQTLYATGQIDREDIKSYIIKNWGTIGSEDAWRRKGITGGVVDLGNWLIDVPGAAVGSGAVAQELNLGDTSNKTSIQNAINRGASSNEVADMILDFYKIY